MTNCKVELLSKARDFIEKNEIDTFRVGAVDLDGVWRGKQLSAEYFLESVAMNGTNIANVIFGWDVADEVVDGLSYTNWDTGYPDVKFVPDLQTLRLIPWEPRTASVICDVKTLAGQALVLSPRDTLRVAVERSNDMGYVPKAAYEFEFYLFDEPIADISDMPGSPTLAITGLALMLSGRKWRGAA